MKTMKDKKEVTKLPDERISDAKLEVKQISRWKFFQKKNLAQDEEHQGNATSIETVSNSTTNNDSSDDEQEHALYNTESFHLQAVVALNTDERLQKWIMPVASASLAMIQIMVLYWLIFEASHPRCSMHDDCNIGEYCNRHGGTMAANHITPRCDNCETIQYMFNPSIKCEEYEDIDEEELVWISKDGDYHPEYLNNSTAIKCLEYLHCERTDTKTNNCDFLDLNLDKVTWPNIIVFIFVALLFSGSLYRDIKESMVEEALLNHTLAKTAITHQSTAQKINTQLLAWIVRLTLRIRKFVLPWVIAAASTTIIVVESLSAKNILLNLLAVAFITEADNIFGTLFLSDKQKRRADQFVNRSKEEVDKDEVNISPLWLRFLAIMPTIIMIVTVLNMRRFLNQFNVLGLDNGCSVSGAVAVGFSFYFPFCIVMIEGVRTFFNYKNLSRSKRFISASIQTCQNSTAIYISLVLFTLAFLAIAGTDDLGTIGLAYGIGLLINVIIGFVLSCCMKSGRLISIYIGVLLSGVYHVALLFFVFIKMLASQLND